MDPQIRKMMKIDVMLEKFIGKNARGGLLFDTPKLLKGYPANVYKAQRSDAGEVVVSRTVIYFEANEDTVNITTEDRITLPGEKQPPIYSIHTYIDGRTGEDDLVEVGI